MTKKFLFVLLLALFSASTVSGKKMSMQELIHDSCGNFENCENEGNILFLQGRPLHEILYGMCKLRLTVTEKVGCYLQAYHSFPSLRRPHLMQGYNGKFGFAEVQSYLFYVRRTCIVISCGGLLEECAERELKCWETLTRTFAVELPFIMGKTLE